MDMDIRELSPDEIEQIAEQMAEQVSELLVKPLQEAMQDALDKITAEINKRVKPLEDFYQQVQNGAAGENSTETIFHRFPSLEETGEIDSLSKNLAKIRQTFPIAAQKIRGQKFIMPGRKQPPAIPTGPVDSPEMMDYYFGARKGAAETRAKFAAAEAARVAAEQAKRQRIREGVAGMFDAGIAQ